MKKYTRLITVLLLIYFCTHLFNLIGIPVFADEAIYIRWAQLIISDPQQYLFFPLNDGKTPLFIWLLIPFVTIINDPLFAGRLLSVIIGSLQIAALTYLFKLCTDQKYSVFPGLLVIILPFWVLYHRFALMDALLALLSTFLLIICASYLKKRSTKTEKIITLLQNKTFMIHVGLLGSLFFLALMTKLPALLLLPSIFVLLFTFPGQKPSKLSLISFFTLGMLISLLLFSLLSLTPAFPQLFSRGSDFLYKFEELKQVGWNVVIKGNFLFIIKTYSHYLTLPLFFVLFITPILTKNRLSGSLIFSSLFFFLPFVFLAKVIHSRYLLPVLPLLTLSLAISIAELQTKIKKRVGNLGLALFLMIVLSPAGYTSTKLISNPETTLLIPDDEYQYFKEWSSGHGVYETYSLILEESKTKTIAVATEGAFGTLPDGILMYLFKQPVTNIYVEGIGQPVHNIQGKYLENAGNYETKWLVVNNFRMEMNLPKNALLHEFCRPKMPERCLQIWDISSIIKSPS